MGGFAAIVDWERPIEPAAIERLLAPIPHRAPWGTARTVFRCAALGEARSGPGDGSPSVTTCGRFSIVGDLRLWDRQSLESRAGGRESASGLDDRGLLLAAYARTGIGFLDDVDGDFAFVIWDDARQRILAVRDRFAVEPLFFELTPTGIRLATEQKQLLTAATEPVRPNDRAVAEFLTNRYRDSRPHVLRRALKRRAGRIRTCRAGPSDQAKLLGTLLRTHGSQEREGHRRPVPRATDRVR